jgi:ribonuclease HI
MEILIFTDGSSIKKGNLQFGGIGIHFPNKEYEDISEPFFLKPITNQRAELYAIHRALQILDIEKYRQINIYTDSMYSINSLTVWIYDWRNNNWKTSNNKKVKNLDIIIPIFKIIDKYKSRINLIHIRAHTKGKDSLSLGNSQADKLAVEGSNKSKKILYEFYKNKNKMKYKNK